MVTETLDAGALDRLAALEQQATPGEWWTDNERTIAVDGQTPILWHELWPAAEGMHGWTRDDDADLIVALRNAAPSLLRLARAGLAAEGEIARLNGELRLALHATQPDASVLETRKGSLGWHRIAEYMMGEADFRLVVGEREAAQWCLARAAECERKALRTIGADRPRTRAIIKESMESLDLRASELAQPEPSEGAHDVK